MLVFGLFGSFNTVKNNFRLEGCMTAGSHDDQMRKERQRIFIQRETTLADTRELFQAWYNVRLVVFVSLHAEWPTECHTYY